jgi:cation transport regulator ChaB
MIHQSLDQSRCTQVISKMGSSNSTLSPIETCVSAICNGRLECYHLPQSNLDQSWNKLYNLALSQYPQIVIRPNNASEVSQAVKCASDNGYKVQARSGGHSYG